MSQKHYVLGAGRVGCLYDYGPEHLPRLKDALSSAEWYVEGACLSKAAIRRMRGDLRRFGIHYFPPKVRAEVGADYIEVSKYPGKCPEGEE